MRGAALLLAVAVSVEAAEKAPSGATPTYTKEVSRIIQKNCEGCHRPGQIGPFPLTTYEEVRTFATEIKRATAARRMPPWHAAPGYGDFRNERRLSDEEIRTLGKWIESGTPFGNKRDVPAKVEYKDDWASGTPDLVLTTGFSYDLDTNGEDEYRCFVMPTSFDSDRTVQTVEVRPGNRKVVHHVLMYADLSGKARQLDSADPAPGYRCRIGGLGFFPAGGLGGWAPGVFPQPLPDGVGRWLPKGADVVTQVHYHKNGLKESDRSSVGFHFNKQPAMRYLRGYTVANLGIRIPAGEEAHRENGSLTLRRDSLVYAVFPHMHLLGKEMRMVAKLPDGGEKDLVWVKNYDFNWQTGYIFKEPFTLPAGTRIEVSAIYDNPEHNPRNPNKPLKDVKWGEETTDEMLVGFVDYITDQKPGMPQMGTPRK